MVPTIASIFPFFLDSGSEGARSIDVDALGIHAQPLNKSVCGLRVVLVLVRSGASVMYMLKLLYLDSKQQKLYNIV